MEIRPSVDPQQPVKDAFMRCFAAGSTVARDQILEQLKIENPAMAEEVRSLLNASESADAIEQVFGFTNHAALAETYPSGPPNDTSRGLRSPIGIAEGPGTIIGPYKLLEMIGEGGMGSVFMAQQITPIKRRVALKIIKPGMDSQQVVARFEAERQALALMDHPNIAKVLDAGTTQNGRPFFVMELVKGIPITEYCSRKKLATKDRLKLFVDLCHGVQHAHQKGIIHRDLKPSNVLATLHDGKPVVKIIDFGIAKAINQELTEHTLFTHFSQMVGTPLYMSPEQAELSGLDVDTRSDVYSLGVLLYELLTGTTPFDRESLKKVGIDEIRRMIRETEPPKPSQRLSTLKAGADTTSTESQSPGQKRLQLELQGELDWIVMKALEKDRERRYESANAFSLDVERYLSGEAVQACPPTLIYRWKKIVQRNRLAIATGLTVACAILIGATVSIVQAARAIRAEQVVKLRFESERTARIAEQEARRDAESAAHREKNQAIVAKLAAERAEACLEVAQKAIRALVTRVGEDQKLKTPELGALRSELIKDAEKFYTGVLAISPNEPDTLLARGYLRQVMLEDIVGALEDYKAAAQLQPNSARIEFHLATIYSLRKDFSTALSHAQRSVELAPASGEFRTRLAKILYKLERREEGKREMLKAAQDASEAWPHRELCSIYLEEGDYDSAIAEGETATRLSSNHDNYLHLARAYHEAGQLEKALVAIRQAQVQVPSTYAVLPGILSLHGQILALLERHHEAFEQFDHALQLEPEHTDFRAQRANVMLQIGREDQVLEEMQRALEPRYENLSVLSWIRPSQIRFNASTAFREGVLKLADAVVEHNGENPYVWTVRANLKAELIGPKAAHLDFASSIAVGTASPARLSLYAMNCLINSDMPGYFEACEKLQQYVNADSKNVPQLSQLWALLLRPRAATDYNPILAAARASYLKNPLSLSSAAFLGASLYRDEQLTEVTNLLSTIAKPQQKRELANYVHCRYFLAMAQFRLGFTDQAKSTLREATELSELIQSSPMNRQLMLRWNEIASLELLLNEARDVLEES